MFETQSLKDEALKAMKDDSGFIGSGSTSVVFPVSDGLVAKVYTGNDSACTFSNVPKPDEAMLRQAMWDYIMGEYVAQNKINVPRQIQIYAEPLRTIRHVIPIAEQVAEYHRGNRVMVFTVMERIKGDSYQDVSQNHKKIADRSFQEQKRRIEDMGIKVDDCNLYRNTIFSYDNNSTYFIDFSRWKFSEDSKLSFGALRKEIRPPVVGTHYLTHS